MGIFFTIFRYLRNYGCPFQGIIHNFRNHGPDLHSIYGIMTLKSTIIYGIMSTNFSGKMARPRQMIGRDTPPPPEFKSPAHTVLIGQQERSQKYFDLLAVVLKRGGVLPGNEPITPDCSGFKARGLHHCATTPSKKERADYFS